MKLDFATSSSEPDVRIGGLDTEEMLATESEIAEV